MSTKVIKSFKLKFLYGGLLSAGKRAESLGKYALLARKDSKFLTKDQAEWLALFREEAYDTKDKSAISFMNKYKKYITKKPTLNGEEEMSHVVGLGQLTNPDGSIHIPKDPWTDDPLGQFIRHKKGGEVKSCQEGGDTSTWDKVKYFIPGVGTYYDIKEAYNDPTLRNVATATLSTAGDLFGAGLIGRTAIQGAKWLSRANKLKKIGYVPIDNAGTWMKLAKVGKTRTPAGYITKDIRVVTTLNFPKPTWHGLATWLGGAEPARFVNESFVADRFDNKEE